MVVVSILIVAAVVLAVGGYLWLIDRSRTAMESLHELPVDLRRADDNQRPPVDGSAGFV